jgi:HD superfamily phosphodiesterase
MLVSLNKIFKFITATCNLYKIDESHGVRHSMDILRISKNIVDEEMNKCPYLLNKEHIIYTSALLHDMCDDKYFKNNDGKDNVFNFLKENNYAENDIDDIMRIINTMSYSKVKKYGYQFKENESKEFIKMYHIVRESDLLCAYEVERCLLYDLYMRNNPFTASFKRADELFQVRMFKHFDDNLFTTKYALREGRKMHKDAQERLDEIKKMILLIDSGD